MVVNGRVWGAAIVASSQQELLPSDTEERVSDFADLVAVAIANAANHAELLASRARIVTAADDARRRLERNLHDGAQQQLIALVLEARMAEASVPAELRGLKQQLAHLASGLTDAHEELQEISRGLHPAILSKGGLLPALEGRAICDSGHFRRGCRPSLTRIGGSRRVLRCGRRLDQCRKALTGFRSDGIGQHRRCETVSVLARQWNRRSTRRQRVRTDRPFRPGRGPWWPNQDRLPA